MTRPIRFFICALIFGFTSCIPRSSGSYFKSLIGFSPTKDVKHLNSYADELGIDASYWLAFECEDSTVQKIISTLQLKKDSTKRLGFIGGLNTKPTNWWDTSFILNHSPFYKDEERVFWRLWYDSKEKKAYLLTFDL
jgi:hypothetical protein